ncbi:MAG: outer membrane beta-barrel protein, partial [Bacteroidota bacterium]|nr:outer membrane beta-barrel protein [Bacteroidota bacterium]
INADTSSGDYETYLPDLQKKFENISKEDVLKVKNISSVKLKYMSIPLLFNYNLDKFIAIQAGPQFSILMNENDNLLKNGQNAFQSGEFSVVGGIQLKILKFRAYGRYVGGLTNVNHIVSSGAWKASSFQLGVGFAL